MQQPVVAYVFMRDGTPPASDGNPRWLRAGADRLRVGLLQWVLVKRMVMTA
jgi:hypothetical protein